MKQGSATANTLGSIAVIYSAFGVILSWTRGTDDDLNTIVAATATGCLYKSSGDIYNLIQYIFNLIYKKNYSRSSQMWFRRRSRSGNFTIVLLMEFKR